MPYTPGNDSIREKILDNIETTLLGINGGPSWALDMEIVRRWEGNEFEVSSMPAAIIIPGPERQDDSWSARIQHQMTVSLLLLVYDQNWKEKINLLLADVRVALLADWTRGGNARTTRITGDEVYESEPSKPIGAATLSLEVLYHTLYHDPTTAI